MNFRFEICIEDANVFMHGILKESFMMSMFGAVNCVHWPAKG